MTTIVGSAGASRLGCGLMVSAIEGGKYVISVSKGDPEMSEYDMKVKVLCFAMEIVSGGIWKADSKVTIQQAWLWFDGIRDGRIADTTFDAVTLCSLTGTC
jgi:hypothetical protein